jgi:hypothetical protein
LFAVYAFMAFAMEAMQASSSCNAAPVIAHLLLGLVDLAAEALPAPSVPRVGAPEAGCRWPPSPYKGDGGHGDAPSGSALS